MKTLILLIALTTASAFAQEVVVTKASPTTIRVVETITKAETKTVDIDDVIRLKLDRVNQMAKEKADRLAEIAKLDEQITEAAKLGVVPSAKVAAQLAEIEAKK